MADRNVDRLPRRERRYKVLNPRRIHTVVERTGGRTPTTIAVELLDISHFGARLSARHTLQFHERFKLQLVIPELDLDVRCAAEVCWIRCGEKQAWSIGSRFESPVPDAILNQLVAHQVLERRAYPRHGLTEQATAYWETDPAAMTVRLVNYSRGGFGLVSQRPGTVGDRIRLMLDQEDDKPVQIVAIARALLEHPEGFLICCEYSNDNDSLLLEEYSTLRDILAQPAPLPAKEEIERVSSSQTGSVKPFTGLSLNWLRGKRKDRGASPGGELVERANLATGQGPLAAKSREPESPQEQRVSPITDGEREPAEAIDELDALIAQFQAERRRSGNDDPERQPQQRQATDPFETEPATSQEGRDPFGIEIREEPWEPETPPLQETQGDSAAAVGRVPTLAPSEGGRSSQNPIVVAGIVTVSAILLMAVLLVGFNRVFPTQKTRQEETDRPPIAQAIPLQAAGARQQVVRGSIAKDPDQAHAPEAQLQGVLPGEEIDRYFTYITQAERAWSAGNAERALAILAQCPPRLRGWEWGCLEALCRSGPLKVSGHSGVVRTVAFSPAGRRIASASFNGTIKLWDPSTGEVLQTLRAQGERVYDIAFSPDGETLAAAGSQGMVELWDTTTGHKVVTLSGHRGIIFSVAFSPDGRTLASAGGDRSVRLWDPSTGQQLHRFAHPGSVYSVAFRPGGEYLASAGSDSTVRLWALKTGEEAATCKGHVGWVTQVSFSPEGDYVVTASNDQSVKTWDATTGREVLCLDAEAGHVRGVVYSPDGQRIVASYDDGALKVWDATTGREVLTLRGHRGDLWAVAFSPDGDGLISASSDGSLRVWKAQRAD